MRLISHKFSDLINLDVKEGRRRSVKRGNYRDFAVVIPAESLAETGKVKSGSLLPVGPTSHPLKRAKLTRRMCFYY
jgi:hypothetical protein